MDIFATLGNILRPEQSKKEFAIIETTAEQSRGYNRATKGRETIAQVEASSAEEALEEWLADKAIVYGISRSKGGFTKDSDPMWLVWHEGDTSADFGDYTVSAETI